MLVSGGPEPLCAASLGRFACVNQEAGECAPRTCADLDWEVLVAAELLVLVPGMCQVTKGLRMAESLGKLVMRRANLDNESSSSFPSNLLSLATGDASFLRQLFSQPSCESPSPKNTECDYRNPPGTKNSKAFGGWEGPTLTLPSSPSF